MEEKKLCFKVEKSNTVADFLKDKLSRRFYRHLKSVSATYWVNHQEIHLYEKINEGNTLVIVYQEPSKEMSWPESNDLPIIKYENDHYIVAYKPAGLLTIPIQACPVSMYQQLASYLGNNEVHILNRLDRETSGLMVVAKDGYARSLLEPVHQHMTRKYMCLVEGRVEGDGTISNFIQKSADSNKRFISNEGKKAISHYRVVQATENTSLLEFVLDTGRTHQIRLHAASIGHPIVGDSLYGHGKENDFLHLCSYQVIFKDPFTEEEINIKIKEDWWL